MTTNLEDALNRITALQQEIISGAYAAKVYFYKQSGPFPYWTNRIGLTPHELDSQDGHIYTYTVTMRLVIGHLGESYDQALEFSLYTTYIPQTFDYFARRIQLQSAAYPAQMTDLDPRGVLITNCTGLAIFSDSGIGVQQVGAEFTMALPIKVFLQQAY